MKNLVRIVVAASMAGVVAGPGAAAFERSESRDPCADRVATKKPLFGDLHVHTRLSFDAFPWDPPLLPRDAYRFARGEETDIPPRDAAGNRLRARLDRPLDFAAVTDHAEGFGETGVCRDPENPAYVSPECAMYRGELQPLIEPSNTYLFFGVWFFADPLPTARQPMPMCAIPGADCEGAEAGLWQIVRDAAEEFYDRTEACEFTTLVGYEWTATPFGANRHRNVIFRNDVVPERPISKVDTGPEPVELWKRLRSECLDAGTGCDVLAIPHNPNLSAGQQFPDPESPADAALQRDFEPLIEIMQAKGSSECRVGFGTADEQCDFEILTRGTFFPFPRPPVVADTVLGPEFTERSYVRNVLKDGMKLAGDGLGTNPWEYGFVGATDSHFGTPGDTDEGLFFGTEPAVDTREAVLELEIENNPGGLTVVWAEENSRDAIFHSLRERETYATSGTRPVVRFFGGWGYDETLCDSSTFAADGYAGGAPMGGVLDAPPDAAAAPRFAVSVLRDPESANVHAVQIIKGWVDENGETHEEVVDVVGDAASPPPVDEATCAPSPAGQASTCATWTDADFDSDERAFWYARVLENPTCRWHTRLCRENGVDPLSAQCPAQAEAAGESFAACCSGDPVKTTIQERAWTSPIWYRP